MAKILNEYKSKEIGKKRRELMLSVMDGEHDLAGAMHILHHYKFCDQFLAYLISKKVTGKQLKHILIHDFNSNMKFLIEWLVMEINHGRTMPIINLERIGKNER